jgi:hypothetical protein
VLILGLTCVYLLTTSVQAAFDDVIAVAGLLFAILYVLTALACVVYYRRLILGRPRHFVTLGLLPMAAAGFLAWILVKSVQAAPASQLWSLVGVVGAGLLMMLVARFWLHSGFFQIAQESDREERKP